MLKHGILINQLDQLAQNGTVVTNASTIQLDFSMNENNNGNYSSNATAVSCNSSVYVKMQLSAVSKELQVISGNVCSLLKLYLFYSQ